MSGEEIGAYLEKEIHFDFDIVTKYHDNIECTFWADVKVNFCKVLGKINSYILVENEIVNAIKDIDIFEAVKILKEAKYLSDKRAKEKQILEDEQQVFESKS